MYVQIKIIFSSPSALYVSTDPITNVMSEEKTHCLLIIRLTTTANLLSSISYLKIICYK